MCSESCLLQELACETSEITICLRIASRGRGEGRGGWSEERGGGNMENRTHHGKKERTSWDIAYAYSMRHVLVQQG